MPVRLTQSGNQDGGYRIGHRTVRTCAVFRLRAPLEMIQQAGRMRTTFFTFIFLAASLCNAYAHLGHVGEVAGHAHWLGVGAVVAAGVLAAVLGKIRKNSETDEGLENTPEEDEGETA